MSVILFSCFLAYTNMGTILCQHNYFFVSFLNRRNFKSSSLAISIYDHL